MANQPLSLHRHRRARVRGEKRALSAGSSNQKKLKKHQAKQELALRMLRAKT
jgi:hypothetical protein